MSLIRMMLVASVMLQPACASRNEPEGRATPRPAAPAPIAAGPDAAVVSIADTLYADVLAFSPETGTWIGAPGARHDLLSDNSLSATARWEAREDELLRRVRAVDPSRLSPTHRLLHARLHEILASSAATRVCRHELQGVGQYGPHMSLAMLARTQPVGTDSLRDAALARFAEVPRYLDTSMVNLEAGITEGYTVPRTQVEPAVAQLDAMLALPVDSSPYLSPAARDSSAEFTRRFRALVETEINPALARYRDFLRDRYLPAARTTTAIGDQPNGAECYRALLLGHSSIDIAPDSVFELGVRQIALLEAELEPVTRALLPGLTVEQALERLRSDTAYAFHSAAEIVADAEAALDRAKVAAPKWFGRLPAADVVVEPCAEYEEAAACPGSYIRPASDGSRPGMYRINTADAASQPRAAAEATTFHETIPGHHLQIGLVAGDTAGHPIEQLLGAGSFEEGWALYAERLADEMGLYSGPLSRAGMLSAQALRAGRLVVDVGLHLKGWSRERALEYLVTHTAEPRAYLASEVDRYIANPGQATSYMLGQLEILALREEARRRLGPAFDIRAFHDLVLERGGIPLPLLRARVEEWVEGQGG